MVVGVRDRFNISCVKNWCNLSVISVRRHFSKKDCQVASDNGEFHKAYIPELVEKNKYAVWESSNYFKPTLKSKSTFTIILPPPNITGKLHLGHALTIAIEDSLLRWHKMRGFSTLWIPGTDHAGIATQVVVEKKLWQEMGQTRHDIGREKFIELVWKWRKEKQDTISEQMKKLGASVDWSREVFTMDQPQSEAVNRAFVKLFDDGLVYRADALVNWSCALQSAISDVEVDQISIEGPTDVAVPGYDKPVRFGELFKFAYKLCDDDGEVIVATTRPETILGDVAVAVHPEDDRYSHLRGRSIWHPFRQEAIPIIFDDFVDRDFGTGAVKITPAHDRTDYDVAKRHNLKTVQVIDESGNIIDEQTDNSASFGGMKRFNARRAIVDRLNELRLARGLQEHAMVLPVCSRSNDVIELLLKPQWFVECQKMAARAVADVREQRLRIEPAVFETVWYSWLENIRDWCVSRQLWWGHRIPAYECTAKGNSKIVWVAAEDVDSARSKAAPKLGVDKDSVICRQDDDVLDTWFSSALLPFSAFGWPQETTDLERHYPLSLMETGHDILFFWVARMVMLGHELTGRLPFTKILLHGIVCDANGRKMSKSLGNVISPEDVISGISLKELNDQTRASYEAGLLSQQELEKAIAGQKKMFPNGIPACGADALRFTLCSHDIKSHFVNFDVKECHVNRLFCNKLWQATKYTLMAVDRWNLTDRLTDVDSCKPTLLPMDRWILSRLAYMVTTVNAAFEEADLQTVTAALKHFFYSELCDVYVESTKPGLRVPEKNKKSDDEEMTKEVCSRDAAAVTTLDHATVVAGGHCSTLAQCLDVGLRCLAPLMPYLTDELYSRVPTVHAAASPPTTLLSSRRFNCMANADYPSSTQWQEWRNVKLEQEVETVLEMVVSVRRLKSSFGLSYKQKPVVTMYTSNASLYGAYVNEIVTLSGCGDVVLKPKDNLQQAEATFDPAAYETVNAECTVHLTIPTRDSSRSSERLAADDDSVDKIDKKETKIWKQLNKLRKMVSTEGYKVKVSIELQQSHSEKIAVLTKDLERLQKLRTSIINRKL